MINQEISDIFREIADILEIKGANVFRVRAYLRAAQNIEGLSKDLKQLAKEGRLSEISGIGPDLSAKIKEYLETGKISMLKAIKKTIPAGLLDLLKIPTVGPKTTKLLYEKLKIKNIPGLESAIAKGKLKGIPGIKEKTIENIQKGIQVFKRGKERLTISQASNIAQECLEFLKDIPEAKNITPAGSLRRRKETIGDIDILLTSAKPEKIMQLFTKMPMVKDVLAQGQTKSAIRTKEDIQIDCRVVEAKSFGAALLYFTGSKNFNIKIRHIAIQKGLKINEYGAFRNERLLAGRTEEEMFKLLGMEFVPPEMREDNGEIELSLKFRLPRLVEISDLKGDLHAHSHWSDGINSIEEMALAAKALGYSYIAITDHSQSLKIARGLSIADLEKKRKEIEGINDKLGNFRVLFGTEVDIDAQGKLDYPEYILREFDIVVAAIHTGFKQSKTQLTRRMVSACKSKHVNIIAHPTGRLWGQREAYDIDLDEILKAAHDTNTALEINSFPQRLDLNDVSCRRAKEKGVKICINTDAHTTNGLSAMQFGVSVARRGWLSKENILNTLSLKSLLVALKK